MQTNEYCDTCGYRGPEGYQCKFCDGANLKEGDGGASELAQLRAENAALREQLAALRRG